MRAAAPAAALFLLPLAAADLRAPPAVAAPALTFGALSDWGGTDEPPYTTPGQLAASESLELLARETDMKFIATAGGNFLPTGLSHNETYNIARYLDGYGNVYAGTKVGTLPWCAARWDCSQPSWERQRRH